MRQFFREHSSPGFLSQAARDAALHRQTGFLEHAVPETGNPRCPPPQNTKPSKPEPSPVCADHTKTPGYIFDLEQNGGEMPSD